MSTVTKPNPKPKDKINVDVVSVDTGHEWIQESRKILALKVVGKQAPEARKLGKRADKVKEKLDQLAESEVLDDKDLKNFQDKFKQTAAEIHEQQIRFEAVKDRLEKAKKEKNKQAIKDDEEEIERIQEVVEGNSKDLERQAQELEETIKQKEKESKEKRKNNPNWADVEKVMKLWRTVRKDVLKQLDTFYADNNDAVGGKKVLRESFDAIDNVDWDNVPDGGNAKEHLKAIVAVQTQVKNALVNYKTKHDAYDRDLPGAIDAVQAVPEFLKPAKAKELLDRLIGAQTAATERNWPPAADKIAGLADEATRLVDEVRNQRETWQIQKQGYASAVTSGIKDNALSPAAQFQLWAAFGAAVRLGEEEKNYTASLIAFSLLSDKIKELKALALARVDNQKEVQRQADGLAALIPQDASNEVKTLCKGLVDKAGPIAKSFEHDSDVGTAADLKKVFDKALADLKAIADKIDGFVKNPTTAVGAMEDEDLKLAKAAWEKAAGDCDRALFEFAGRGGDTDANLKPDFTKWNDERKRLETAFQKDQTELRLVTDVKPLETLTASVENGCKDLDKKIKQLQDEIAPLLKNVNGQIGLILSGLNEDVDPAMVKQFDMPKLTDLAKSTNATVLEGVKTRLNEFYEAMDKSPKLNWDAFYKLDGKITTLKKRVQDSKILKKYQPTHRKELTTKLEELTKALEKNGADKIKPLEDKYDVLLKEVDTAKALSHRAAECEIQFTELEKRIRTEIPEAVEKLAPGTTIDVTRLPIMTKLTSARNGLSATTEGELAALKKTLRNLNDSVDLLLADDDELRKLIGINAEEEQKEREKSVVDSENSAAYLDLVQQAKALLEQCKSAPKADRKLIKSLLDRAEKTAEKRDYVAAGQQAAMAVKLATSLVENPQGSSTTSRGKENLKFLIVNWGKGIATVTAAIKLVLDAADKACSEDSRQPVQSAAKTPATIVNKRLLNFDKDAFNVTISVLQAPAPEDEGKQAADRATKKKYRELALQGVRKYRGILNSDPVLLALLGRSPWGNLNFVPLVRALSDLDLNIQRIDG